METKILITGGSGFIGTNLVEYYLNRHISVLNLDIVEPRNIKHIAYYKNIDICDKSALIDLFLEFKPTHIVHLAARTDLNGDRIEDYKANTMGVYNLVEAISASDSIVKTIFASSMLVCKVGYRPKDSNDYSATTLYGESKILTETYIKNSLSLKSAWNIIRPTSIWGPWFGSPYRNFFDMVLQNRYVNIKNGSATKTFGFVGNTVYQINELLFWHDNSIDKRTFYIGDNPASNISEWANEILSQLGRKPAIEIHSFVFKILAHIGDGLQLFGIQFPMTSFRLKNMTTDNIQDLDDLYGKIGPPPFTRKQGVDLTIRWLKANG